MSDITVRAQGIEQAKQMLRRAERAVTPRGALGTGIRKGLTLLQIYAAGITHRDTGTLSAAHLIQYASGKGYVYPSPYAINPKSRKPASYYGPFEEARGGSHAFYRRTVDAMEDRVVATVTDEIAGEIAG